MRSVIYSDPGKEFVFPIPNDCSVIYVSGCGGGGGGGGANSAAGACGGSAAPQLFRLPLSVVPGKAIAGYVGIAGLGGASGATGLAINTEGYKRASSLSGSAIISPLCAGNLFPLLSLGWGGQGSQSSGGGTVPPNIYAFPGPAQTYMLSANVNAADWNYSQQTMPVFLMAPVLTGDCGRGGGVNPYAYGLAGYSTLNAGGLGVESVSDATYGSGGAGGGGIFGKGGVGGVYSGGIGAGGAGTGYGSGGGGGSGGPGPYGAGGDGTQGIVIIEY